MKKRKCFELVDKLFPPSMQRCIIICVVLTQSQPLVHKIMTDCLFIRAHLLWYIALLQVLCHDMPLHITKTVKLLTT